MSRTYNAPPSVLRTKLRKLGRALGNEARMVIAWLWTAVKMTVGTVMRLGRPAHSMLDDRPRQLFGLRSITQDLLDKAERERRGGLPPDPFEALAGHRSTALDRAPRHPVAKFHAARHPEH